MRTTTHVNEYNGIDEVLEHFAGEFNSEEITNFFLQYYAGDDGDVDSSKAKGNPEYTITVESDDEWCDYYEDNRYTVPLPNRDAADELAAIINGTVTFDGSKNTGAKTFRITYRSEIYIKADSKEEARSIFEVMNKAAMDSRSQFVEISSFEEQ